MFGIMPYERQKNAIGENMEDKTEVSQCPVKEPSRLSLEVQSDLLLPKRTVRPPPMSPCQQMSGCSVNLVAMDQYLSIFTIADHEGTYILGDHFSSIEASIRTPSANCAFQCKF